MKCPACHREQPMSFKCRACGADLMKRPAAVGHSPRTAGSSQQPRLQTRAVDDMKVTMPVSALRAPRPAPAEVPPPPLPEDNPYSAPSPAAPVYAFSPATEDEVLGGRWARFGAQVLDNIFLFVSAIPGYVVIIAQAAGAAASGSSNADVPAAGLAVVVLGVALMVIYQIVLLLQRGQTLGKRIVGLRIVNADDGGHPGGVRLILLRAIVGEGLGGIPLVGPLYSLADALFIFREDRRCIHDLIAGTKVVEAR